MNTPQTETAMGRRKMLDANEARQEVRKRYRLRVENKLGQFQLGAILAQRDDGDDSGKVSRSSIDAATLHHIAKKLAGLALKSCNVGLTPHDNARWENLKREAEAIAAPYGLKVTTDGDVRGYVVRLHGDGLYRNGWGDGFGVA